MKTISFETRPEAYKHWKLKLDPPLATLSMDVIEDGGLDSGYQLKLNSYDLGVDIELADAVTRLRFEHPDVRTLIIRSAKDRVFCSGANIYMLGSSSHAFKVNFCKFTNETRLSLEDASAYSGLKSLAAVNGSCAGGGYELALACDEIVLVDDGNSAVSLPEVALLGVLPGTGGLTRVTDKRHVRRDRADFFCTVAEGIKGKRAVEWGLVDAVVPKSRFDEEVQRRALALAATSDRPQSARGISWRPIHVESSTTKRSYSNLVVEFDRARRMAKLTVTGPAGKQPETPDAIVEAGVSYWPLAFFRELDHALLHLRMNEPEIGTLVLQSKGDLHAVLDVDRVLHQHRDHWLVREILLFIKRTLKRLDLSAKSLIALVEPGSCFAGTLLELALASDRSYMLDHPDEKNAIALSVLNRESYPMSNGLSRLAARFYPHTEPVQRILAREGAVLSSEEALELGLVTFAPDDIDWDDEVRIAIEERASLSPDALTGMEANLRFPGPETLETKIFGRLSAWQNWIFQRPNAVGDRGALTVYGQAAARPEFDWRRT